MELLNMLKRKLENIVLDSVSFSSVPRQASLWRFCDFGTVYNNCLGCMLAYLFTKSIVWSLEKENRFTQSPDYTKMFAGAGEFQVNPRF